MKQLSRPFVEYYKESLRCAGGCARPRNVLVRAASLCVIGHTRPQLQQYSDLAEPKSHSSVHIALVVDQRGLFTSLYPWPWTWDANEMRKSVAAKP